jgi:calcium-dependent protein kinase
MSENSRHAFDAISGSPGRIKKREGTGSTELINDTVSTAQKDQGGNFGRKTQ